MGEFSIEVSVRIINNRNYVLKQLQFHKPLLM